MSPNIKKYLSVFLTTAGGALVSYVAQQLAEGVPTSTQAWEAIGRGAFIAMTAALLHLWQAPPVTAVTGGVPGSRGFVDGRVLGFLAAIAGGATILACGLFKPGETPAGIVGQVEATVLADLEAGDSLTQVQTDVAKDVASDVNSPLVAQILDYALDTLIEAETLAPAVAMLAANYKAQVHPIAVAAARK